MLSCAVVISFPRLIAEDVWIRLNDLIVHTTLVAYPCGLIFQSISAWLVLVISVLRFISIQFPMWTRNIMGSHRKGLYVVAGVYLLSIFYNVPRMFELKVCLEHYAFMVNRFMYNICDIPILCFNLYLWQWAPLDKQSIPNVDKIS